MNDDFEEWFDLNRKWLVKERTKTQIGFEDTLQKAFKAGKDSSLLGKADAIINVTSKDFKRISKKKWEAYVENKSRADERAKCIEIVKQVKERLKREFDDKSEELVTDLNMAIAKLQEKKEG